MAFKVLKLILPNRPVPTRIWRGPFRGALIVMNPRDSLRKIFGLYEHELNDWLEMALSRVTRVIDVGANDGYFSFGAAAAFRRLGTTGEIIAIEMQDQHILTLRRSAEEQDRRNVTFHLVQAYAGREDKPGFISLDSIESTGGRTDTLVKIDVEGAELDVIAGGKSWLTPSNLFVVEVHKEQFLEPLKQTFAERGCTLRQIEQRPLRLLGTETRDAKNWWLVSDLCIAAKS